MDVKAIWKYVKISPQKLRLVADLVRGKSVNKARSLLVCCNKKGAKLFDKLMKSAIANAYNTREMDMDSLYVKKIFVDEGPSMVRFMPRAMGRANRLSRKSSHATVVLSDN